MSPPGLSSGNLSDYRRTIIALASFLMDEQENPAVVQAVMRHAQMDMTLYYSHSNRKAKRAAVENYAQHLAPGALRVPVRAQATIQ